MRVKELVLVIAVIALAAGLFGGPPEQAGVEPPKIRTASAQVEKKAASPEWTVHGVSPAEPYESLLKRFGEPLRDRTDDNSRFTVFSTPRGELRRGEYFDERTVSLSGTELELVGQGEIREGMKRSDLEFLGEPMFSRKADDWVSYQYDGAEIYFRDGQVFGVVGQVQLPR
jgi:hypothetical protein